MTGGYSFLFIDGGDGASGNFDSFIGANRSQLESFVSAGGRLLINAARWTPAIDPLDLGFGVRMFLDDYHVVSRNGYAVDPSNPLFAGPIGAAGSHWTSRAFAHDELLGDYGTALILGRDNRVVLAAKQFGSGFVMFGTITDPSYQAPAPEAYNLRANMIAYASAGGGVVPEPASFVLAGLGMAAVAAAAVRRRV